MFVFFKKQTIINESKRFVCKKTWLICDRNKKFNEFKNQNRRHIVSKRIQCFSSIVIIRDEDNDEWFLKIVNVKHNHLVIFVDFHSTHKKLAIIKKMKNEIFKTLIIQIRSSQILFALRVLDSMTNINFGNSENLRIINSFFKFRNIYNVKTQFRRET